MIYLWRRDFSPWSCCCSTDRMCGMRVCEWTQRELTLDIRFMGGDYDPGHSGRNREKDKQSRGRWERQRRREKGRENGAKAMKWNEVFDLPRTGQVLLVECLIWCRANERMDTTSCSEHSLWPHNTEKERVAHGNLFICHTALLSLSITLVCIPSFLFIFLEQHTLKSGSLQSLSGSFLERHLVLLRASVVASNGRSFLISFILIDAVSAVKRYPPADTK